MTDPNAIIENPIVNSPFDEPRCHYQLTDEGLSDTLVAGRRDSVRFVPIAQPKKKGAQRTFDTEWTRDRAEPNQLINQVRARVGKWRRDGHPGVTHTTRRLLRYWTNPEREKKLFFCQIEALETAIYVAEVAEKAGDAWIHDTLRKANDLCNPGLHRVAFKMATGSGKTVVMGMLIAWQALNKLANPTDARFSDSFLLVAPGITIRDRLRVLLPNDPDNYYRQRDLLPPEDLERLGRARIVITNFHAFQQREKIKVSRTTKQVTFGRHGEKPGVFTETPAEMVRRVCRELGNKKNIVVLNDEAHHCYRRRPDGKKLKLSREERNEASKREDEARIWLSGIEAVRDKLGVRAVFDLSATPFFLRGSGWDEGTLFPWVVSDYSLLDAIESGIVKIPRVPVADDQMTGELPLYRHLWPRIRDDLPKTKRKKELEGEPPKLPKELQAALHTLYHNYEQYHAQWAANAEAQARGLTPPVFIVVCNNTAVSKIVFDYIAGWEKVVDGEPRVQAGNLELFRNDDGRGGWRDQPNAFLIDSEQLEAGTGMSAEFKALAQGEIAEFKREYAARYPGRDPEQLSEEDLLREVMNTVGKAGKLGERIKCVVSVSMLTEGWDANTVTHVLGVRAFGTQLLCEQVVGRALRRMSYATVPRQITVAGQSIEFDGFTPEYAEVYGVPFSFIPTAGSQAEPVEIVQPTRVRALSERTACEITFPRLAGYRYDVQAERLRAEFTDATKLVLSTRDVPVKVQIEPIVGLSDEHTLDALRDVRMNTIAFQIARIVLDRYFTDDDNNPKLWLFPQLLQIAKRWLESCLVLQDDAFPQMVWLTQWCFEAADKIYKAIVATDPGDTRLLPIMRPYDQVGSTRFVDFDTTREVYKTNARKCHVSHVVCDSDWEAKLAQSLEAMDEVLRYVKNHQLGFQIPYILDGDERHYVPDFIIHLDDGHGPDDPLQLLLEVTGERKREKAIKVDTARTLWVPAVNNHGGFGRWTFLEITDPWDAKQTIRSMLEQPNAA